MRAGTHTRGHTSILAYVHTHGQTQHLDESNGRETSPRDHMYTYTHTHIHIMYICKQVWTDSTLKPKPCTLNPMCLCVCVCVCVCVYPLHKHTLTHKHTRARTHTHTHTHNTHTTQSTQPDGSRAEFQVTAGANLRDSLIDNGVQVSLSLSLSLGTPPPPIHPPLHPLPPLSI